MAYSMTYGLHHALWPIAWPMAYSMAYDLEHALWPIACPTLDSTAYSMLMAYSKAYGL